MSAGSLVVVHRQTTADLIIWRQRLVDAGQRCFERLQMEIENELNRRGVLIMGYTGGK